MRSYGLKIFVVGLVLFGLICGYCLVMEAHAAKNESKESAEEKEQIEEEDSLEKTKEEAERAKGIAELAAEDVEYYRNKLKRQKEIAEIMLLEAEAAKEKAAILKEKAKIDKSLKKDLKDARKIAKEKKDAAELAVKRIAPIEKDLEAAKRRVKLEEDELDSVLMKVAKFEMKEKEERRALYKKLIHTGLIVLIGYLFIFLFARIINRRVKDPKVRHLTRRNVVYLIHILMILYIFFYWVEDTSSIIIFLSVVSAGIVLALQDVILSIAGWLLILVRRPFEVGDRIEMGGVKGDVIDIRFFETSLLELGNWIDADQSTGRIVNVPNSAVFKRATHNYSRGFEFIWNEIAILVTFESDWKRAKEIMSKHGLAGSKEMGDVVRNKIEEMAKHYMIPFENLTPAVYVDIKDNGVELTLRYLTAAKERRTTQDALCRAILDDFGKEETVNFAYPTYRLVR